LVILVVVVLDMLAVLAIPVVRAQLVILAVMVSRAQLVILAAQEQLVLVERRVFRVYRDQAAMLGRLELRAIPAITAAQAMTAAQVLLATMVA
jgi:hypothetical protein